MDNLNYDLIKEKIEIMIGNGQILEKDLSKVCQHLLLLDDANGSFQKKQAVKLLIPYLDKNYIFKNRALEIVESIENSDVLDDKTINLLNRYIGILNDADSKVELKEEVWKNYNIIIENIKNEELINRAINFIKNEGKEYDDFVLGLINILKHSNVEEEKRDAAFELRQLLENNNSNKKRR